MNCGELDLLTCRLLAKENTKIPSNPVANTARLLGSGTGLVPGGSGSEISSSAKSLEFHAVLVSISASLSLVPDPDV